VFGLLLCDAAAIQPPTEPPTAPPTQPKFIAFFKLPFKEVPILWRIEKKKKFKRSVGT